jgi:hypothetical protein
VISRLSSFQLLLLTYPGTLKVLVRAKTGGLVRNSFFLAHDLYGKMAISVCKRAGPNNTKTNSSTPEGLGIFALRGYRPGWAPLRGG